IVYRRQRKSVPLDEVGMPLKPRLELALVPQRHSRGRMNPQKRIDRLFRCFGIVGADDQEKAVACSSGSFKGDKRFLHFLPAQILPGYCQVLALDPPVDLNHTPRLVSPVLLCDSKIYACSVDARLRLKNEAL